MKTILLAIFFTTSNIVLAQSLTIEGPGNTCPNEFLTYRVYAKNLFGVKLAGAIGWAVYIDGTIQDGISNLSPLPCNATSFNKDFYIDIIWPNTDKGWQDEGNVELRVSFVKSNSCTVIQQSKFITSEAVDPGIPATAPGELKFCPGESKTVYLDPGLPGPYNSPANCSYHFKWFWSAPLGWSITEENSPGTGSSNEYSGLSSVKITAPSNISSNPMYIRVEADPVFKGWISPIERQIEIGYPENISMSGPTKLCGISEGYSLSNVPSGTSISWNHSSNIQLLSPQGNNPAYFKAIATGGGATSFVSAALNSNCGTKTFTKQYISTSPSGYV